MRAPRITSTSRRSDWLRFGAGVNALASADINGDGVHEIIIGRDDGVVDVFGLDETSVGPVRLCSEVSSSTYLLI